MKTKVFILLVAVMSLWSCSEDDPPPLYMRAASNEFFFDAKSTSAVQNPDGSYTITGEGDRGTISWTQSGIEVGEYLPKAEQFVATYTNENGVVYTTIPQNGFIIVDVDNSGSTISGRFRMRVYNGGREIHFFKSEFRDIVVGAPEPIDEETGD